jgi:hypothetical protein
VKARVVTLVILAAACGGPSGQPRAQPPRQLPPEPSPQQIGFAAEDFAEVRDGFMAWYFEAHPVRASELGVHRFDAALPAMDRPAVQRRIDTMLDWLAELESVPFSLMRDGDRYDYAVLEYAMRAALLDLEEARTWATDPRLYVRTVAAGLSTLAEREYAPLEDRIDALVSRMDAAPGVLAAGRENVNDPPTLWTELALADTRGLLTYVETDLPALIRGQAGGSLPAGGLEETVGRLADALREHEAWLREDLLPRSGGSYRLGRYLFLRKLLYEEHIDLPLEELVRLNEAAISRYQEWVARVAEQVDPNRTPRAIMDSITAAHPDPEALVPTAREMMEAAFEWTRDAGVVTIPDGATPIVRESPPFARGGFASMDAPGPFESAGLDAYYNITNVDPAWTAEERQQHLTYFNYPGLLGVTVHETFPGHYVQLLHARELSDVRKTFPARSFTEGWAHYAEQLALDEGFRDDDPGVRLGQLRRALQRHARWYAGVALHAQNVPLDEVVRRFMEIAYFEEFPARREVVRATYDPTYLYYALGRMQILELRKDYAAYLEEEEDETFELRAFHDRLLELGLPLPLAREVMIPSRPEPRRASGF